MDSTNDTTPLTTEVPITLVSEEELRNQANKFKEGAEKIRDHNRKINRKLNCITCLLLPFACCLD